MKKFIFAYLILESGRCAAFQFEPHFSSIFAQINFIYTILFVPIIFTVWSNRAQVKNRTPFILSASTSALGYLFWATSFKIAESKSWYFNIIYPDSETVLIVGTVFVLSILVVSLMSWVSLKFKMKSRT